MAFGNVIAPPPALAVQEVKDLIALITDPKKASQLLAQIEASVKSANEAVSAQSDKSLEISNGLKMIEAQKADLVKRESEVAGKLQLAQDTASNFVEREAALVAGEHELEAQQKNFSSEYAAVMNDLKKQLKEAAKAKADAEQMQAEAEALIKKYNDKEAALKNAIGN